MHETSDNEVKNFLLPLLCEMFMGLINFGRSIATKELLLLFFKIGKQIDVKINVDVYDNSSSSSFSFFNSFLVCCLQSQFLYSNQG